MCPPIRHDGSVVRVTPIRRLSFVAIVAAFAGCAYEQPADPLPDAAADRTDLRAIGTVTAVDFVAGASRGFSPPGTVTGSVDGGSDRTGGDRTSRATTPLSAAGSPLAGNAIPGRPESSPGVYRVSIRYRSGGDQTIEVFDAGGLRAGDRVRVDGNRISRD